MSVEGLPTHRTRGRGLNDIRTRMTTAPGLYLAQISLHGLIRGHDLELGRDADTGGQTRYVVELARAAGQLSSVARVELFTRRIADPAVHADYAVAREPLGDSATIVRLDDGTPGYLPKEQLWDHVDAFVDAMVTYLRDQDRLPDVLHSHYADAGYVGARLSHRLGIPLLHTGHSLGRIKRRRLIAAGMTEAQVEARFAMSRRVAAEELTLASAVRVITSTHQEIDEQYGRYDYHRDDQMTVLPPGTDLTAFHPPDGTEAESPLAAELARFLREPEKPLVVVLARPVPRKNLVAQVEAFGAHPELRRLANLVIVAGTRDDIAELSEPGSDVLTDLLVAIDRHDLWGHVALPKHVAGDDIGLLYRLAALRRGIHVNAALTEPFGLTLIEAAASGLPIVATNDGGPRDILRNCENGVLVDPLDEGDIAAGMMALLVDDARWDHAAERGLAGVRRVYSWEAHAQRYLEVVREAQEGVHPLEAMELPAPVRDYDRAIATDLDLNLLAQPEHLGALADVLRANRRSTAFVIATGRTLESARPLLHEHGLPEPDVLITGGGTRIDYRPDLTTDEGWAEHIDHAWQPRAVRRVLSEVPGLERQPRRAQRTHKISYYIDVDVAPPVEEIEAMLYRAELSVNVVLSFGQFLDILPLRASKGLALRHAMTVVGVELERVLAVGGSGADEDMMRGQTLAAVVQNRHHEELSQLTETDRIHFTASPGALGILEAIEHYDIFGACRAPEAREPSEGSEPTEGSHP